MPSALCFPKTAGHQPTCRPASLGARPPPVQLEAVIEPDEVYSKWPQLKMAVHPSARMVGLEFVQGLLFRAGVRCRLRGGCKVGLV